jgi:mannose-6-phosphate isomerase-like protein (cupin superfamily)
VIRIHRFDAEKLERYRVRPGTPTEYVDWIQLAHNEESVFTSFQEFRKEEPLEYWVMWYDEIHFGLSGKAKLIYSMPPLYEEELEIEVGAGDLYLLPTGSQQKWEVLGDEPYRMMCVVMPRPKWLDLTPTGLENSARALAGQD